MTLLDRLEPEYKVKLDLIYFQYPSTYECIIGSLTQNEYYTELSIGEAVILFQHLDLDQNILNLHKIFIS